MELYLYNTLSREKEVFRPIEPGRAGIYTCGPTVYGPAHIGNLRSYIFPDILKKTLRRLGYEVRHVMNITDVGHLTSDADEGEDKMERAARQSKRSAWDIAAEYTEAFLRDTERLHIERADVMPRATEHIGEQIALIQRLEERGLTYRTDDGIYFDTARFPEYGRMARLKAEGLQEGARVEVGGKRNKTDFALWKFSPPDVQRQMEWDSPWGRGFPGWHIECSAMSMRYLGERFDIHTGGTDHIPVHHTNEIAQSQGATGHPFVNYWLHGEHLVLAEGVRMGKSEGNFLRLQDLVDEGFDPLSFRYLALNNNYRKYLNFSTQALQAAETALFNLRRLVRQAGGEQRAEAAAQPPEEPPAEPPNEAAHTVLAEVADDLNTPKALATLWTALRGDALSDADKLALAAFADGILSLDLFDFSRLQAAEAVPEEILAMAEQRWQARKARNFADADRLRDEIIRRGYEVRDRKDGYEVVRAAV